MRAHLTRVTAAAAAAVTVSAMAVVLPTAAQAAPAPDGITITEWMYKNEATGGEFVELTNVSSAAIDMTGWSYATGGAAAGSVDLSAFGSVAAGESVVITESSAAAFRADWGLLDSVRIVGDVDSGIGRADEFAVYDADDVLVDRLAYDDASIGGPRTDGVSGTPISADALGADDATLWRASAAGDDDGSWSAGDIGSPGTSRFGDAIDPRDPDAGTDEPAPVEIDPNWADVRINEVSSDNDDAVADGIGDAIELYNAGDADVDITGWLQADSGGAAGAQAFEALLDGAPTTTIPAQGFVVFTSTKGLGSGGDAVSVYLPDADRTEVDSVAYGAGEAGSDEGNEFGAASFARCGDDEGDFVPVAARSFGASNAVACESPLTNPQDDLPTLDCAPEAPEGTGTLPGSALPATTWPGDADVTVADELCAWMTTTGPEGRDVSGLVFDPSDSGVLYAVKNKSWVFRLVDDDGVWTPDTANGWAAGKEIFFPGSTDPATNQPDTEGLTVGPDGALYITTERDNQDNTTPLNSVLRFDPTATGTELVATDQWDLTDEFPELHAGSKTEANLGFEGVTFVPDEYLVEHGFIDENTGDAYVPEDYPDHGAGLFFAALENDGKLYAYALDDDDENSFERIAVVDTGMGHVMDVQFDAGTGRIWAMCDNTCGVVLTVLGIDDSGAFAPEAAYDRPAGLPNVNIEGFALAPIATATDGTREVVFSDDGIWGDGPGSGTHGHALYSARLDATLDFDAPAGPGDGSDDGDDSDQPGTDTPGTDQPGTDQPGTQEPGSDAWATVQLSAGRVAQGGSVRVSVSGLTPGQQIAATLHSDPIVVPGIPAADADGRVAFTVRIPDDFATGPHTLEITSGGLDPIEAALTVVAPGRLATTGAEAPWGIALGAAVLLTAGALLFVTRRRGAIAPR